MCTTTNKFTLLPSSYHDIVKGIVVSRMVYTAVADHQGGGGASKSKLQPPPFSADF